jgi:short-subunit dehydrogenase
MTTVNRTGNQSAPVALVAGASRGLGLLIARELGRQGYSLMICARTEDELARGADQLRAAGCTVVTARCDIANAPAVEELVERTERELGPIEVLVCVAGVIQVGPLQSLNRSHFTSAINVMLWGPINTSLAVVPRMRERGRGHIGIITSLGGLISAPHLLPYSTAKFGAVGFARGLRSELSGTGVSVTTVAPGLMRTGSHLRATFVGNQGREFAWFGTAASLPLLSMDAERAAERMVRAILRGQSVLITTPLAQIAPRVDALFPRAASALLSLTARLLPNHPGAGSDGATIEGWQAAKKLPAATRLVVDQLSRLGRTAARRFNEEPGNS